MLYVASIIESFLFGFIESYVGIFNFNLSLREVTIIVGMSVVGIFFSLLFYAALSDTEDDLIRQVRLNTRQRMKDEGYTLNKGRGR